MATSNPSQVIRCPHRSLQSELTDLLVNSKCLKFGEFTLKSGLKSKYYIDMRESSHSSFLFHRMVEAVVGLIPKEKHYANDDWTTAALGKKKVAITGVPYGVVPLAGAVAHQLKLPYFPVRKEVKTHGNKSGSSDELKNHEYIVIEDVISTGSSIIETIYKLSGRNVTDVIVLVDREMGGVERILERYPSVKISTVLTASKLLEWTLNNEDEVQ